MTEMTLKKLFRHKLLPLVYEKRITGSSLYSVEKRKCFKVTLFKREKTDAFTRTHYLKFIHSTKFLSSKRVFPNVRDNDFGALDVPVTWKKPPLVSIIVPNYNHARYLKERLDSIYNQTYRHFEVILLDDCSTDGSVEVLKEYARKYPENTRLVANEHNSGKVFHQWNKGLELARGEFVWIAESDDYCDRNFLETVLQGLRHQSVMLSFARSVFMQEGKQIWSQEEYLADLPVAWNAPFIMSAHKLVSKAFAIKNVVPNVSSAVFRNIGTIPADIISQWEQMSLCGDWLFYLWLIKGGAVSYTNRVNNYYRIHPGSTSLKIQKTLDYYTETLQISCFVARNYAVDAAVFEVVKKNLIQHCLEKQCITVEEVEKAYSLDKIKESMAGRQPNVLICTYAMVQGGGEVFPIYLANELKRQGIAVTFVDFRGERGEKEIRQKLDRNVPLLALPHVLQLRNVMTMLGADIIHTHHGTIDSAVANAIGNRSFPCKQVVTLHGMYEAVPEEELNKILKAVLPVCSCFVYIADKNLLPLKHVQSQIRLKKIGNGLPYLPLSPYSRTSLGIEEDAFCLSLVSRGFLYKGWMEAVEAVKRANATIQRPVHLLLVGDGECYEALKQQDLPPFIHLMGRQGYVRNYFAMSDAGLLPSYFKGESFPLVVIESLMSGAPIIASDVGEIRNMITDTDGGVAGALFELKDGKVPVDTLTDIIVRLATDSSLYGELKRRVAPIARKFEISCTARQYIDVYNKVWKNVEPTA